MADLESLSSSGFFVGWPHKPSDEKFREILAASYTYVLAFADGRDDAVGFVTVISDGVFSAFIPLLEVKKEFHGQGIGRRLVEEAEARLPSIYSLDIVCDAELDGFYDSLGYLRRSGRGKRFRQNFAEQ
ncbi:MAG TPA: GNAT family N-acetyltransferase [Chthoniobacterales bacterium]